MRHVLDSGGAGWQKKLNLSLIKDVGRFSFSSLAVLRSVVVLFLFLEHTPPIDIYRRYIPYQPKSPEDKEAINSSGFIAFKLAKL